MTTDESIMLEMLERATTPDKDNDELSIQMFCIVVKSNHSLIQRAQELIVDKIKTLNTRKAVKAIHLLEECMTKCGNDFQDECAKFRFLNELIRLVSKKYQGSETPKEIKQRIMECLLLWTTEFPNKLKIREAYDMLFKEGCVDNNEGFSSNAAKRECVLGIDENMLSKLLKSGNPEDLKRANLHIQHRVNQEARRTELILQHKKELQEIQTIISLLNQMLDSDSQNDPDVQETIKELFETCNRHKPVLKRMPELLESTNEDLIAETLDVNDLLQDALNRYKKKYMQTNNGESDTISNSADLLSELFDSSLKDTKIGDEPQKQAVTNSSSLTDSLQELTKIFGSEFTTNSSTAKMSTPKSPNELFPLFPEVLQPSKITETKHNPENHDLKVGSAQEQKQVPFALNDIDKLSEELLKKSLNHTEIVGQFTKELKKPTLNDLANLKPLEHSYQTSAERNPEDTNFKKHIVGIPKGSKETNIDEQTENIKEHLTEFEKLVHVKHLSEVNVELDEIVPTTEVRMLVDDNDLEFKLVFTDSRPAKNVSVFVLTGTNKSQLTMSDFHIDASVKKPCKVRLLPLSDSTLHPSKPFRPSTPINQILLLLNASGGNVDITFLLSYKMGDDPDPVKDSIVAKDIPYVD